VSTVEEKVEATNAAMASALKSNRALHARISILEDALRELVEKYCTGYENCDLNKYHKILETRHTANEAGAK
jgi:hypothetical protein